ncbi:uncharacterized protein [Diabrotica undecimpunctata]|uniref:uncharacterized protein n=1 Tax=Diabrotica undecimpunctata TaxID=50387 RepID=UPI003B63520B
MSPKLFITVLEHALKSLEWESKGININDDLKAASDMVNELSDAARKLGLNINYQKSKMMTNLVPSHPLTVEIEIVDNYIYLRHTVLVMDFESKAGPSKRIRYSDANYEETAEMGG